MKKTEIMAVMAAATTLYLHGYKDEAAVLDGIVAGEQKTLETQKRPRLSSLRRSHPDGV